MKNRTHLPSSIRSLPNRRQEKARDAMAIAYGIPTSKEYRRKRVIQEANPHFLPMPDARKYRHSQLPN